MTSLSYQALSDDDLLRLEEWMKKDPEHTQADPTLFTIPKLGLTPFAIYRDGKPLFYVALENVCRVHIQFNPEGNKLSTVKTLITGFKWLCEGLMSRGYREVIFDSRYDSLIAFCKNFLGFKKRDEDYSVRLT